MNLHVFYLGKACVSFLGLYCELGHAMANALGSWGGGQGNKSYHPNPCALDY